MKADVKERWLKALKSGEFRKTKGQLARRRKKKNGGYNHCCLGVLCEIEGLEKTKVNRTSVDWDEASDGLTYELNGSESALVLPFNLKLEVGINEEQEVELTNLNDSTKTWDEVIKYIEEKL